MKRLLLFFALCSSLGAWAQTFTAETASVAGEPSDRSVTITLDGNWLDGENVAARTDEVINLIMGYDAETSAFVKDNAYGKVIIKSAEGTTATVNQALVRQLVTGKAGSAFNNGFALENNKIEYLDLSGVAVTEYVGHGLPAVVNENSTLFARNGGVSPIKYFAMPAFAVTEGQTYTIPANTTAGMENLEELIIPVNTKKIEAAGFADGTFSKFKLNQGLEFIGNSAFYANSERLGMETLEVPSSVKYIGPGAFNFRVYTDLYFHSAQAPICPIGKSVISGTECPFLYDICYDGNGGQNTTEGDDYEHGYANRNNYKNGNYWFVMIHYPSSEECAERGETLDISSYKDETRVYRKVYGSIYYPETDVKGGREIAVVGKEQEYIEKEKIWARQGSYDYVGQETSVMTYEGKSTGLAPTGDAIPAEARGKGCVDSGYEDTYRGLNYIWPSQSQYDRAHTTVALGYKWDGVTKYRPTLTAEQIAYMVEDGLSFNLNGKDITVGNGLVYTEADAAAYNATLDGAIKAGDAKELFTAESAAAYNATLDGAVKEGDKHSYSDSEAYAYNDALPGAVKAGDLKTPATTTTFYTWTEFQATNNWRLSNGFTEDDFNNAIAAAKLLEHPEWNYADFIKTLGSQATYYQDYEAKQYNQNLPGAVSPGSHVTFTAETAAAYNATLSGAVKEGETKRYTAEEANAINATLSGAKTAGYDIYYTQAEADTYNQEHGITVVKAGDVKTPAQDAVYYTLEEAIAEGLVDAETTQDDYDQMKYQDQKYQKSAYVAPTYYNNETAAAENESRGAKTTASVLRQATEADAAAYNATLNGAVHAGDQILYTAAEAVAYNAALEGARAAGYTIEKNYDDPDVADYLSMIAFQSTRRVVFAANDGRGDRYKINIPNSKAWWTICLPFDLTKAQIDKYFGVGSHVCLFNKVDRDINPSDGSKPYVKFYFTADQYVGKTDDQVVLQAHVPYMIFPTIDENDAVYLANGIPMDEFYIRTGNPTPTVVTASDDTEYRFIGNYDTKLPVEDAEGNITTQTVTVPQYSYIYAKKNSATGKHPYQFWFTQSAKIAWGANKCVIQSTSNDRGLTDNNTFFQQEENEVRQISIFGDWSSELEGDETDIEEVIFVVGNDKDQEVIYSIDGKRLNSAPKKGIYISNGKKYMVR